MPAVLNAANEVAVEAFLKHRCSFKGIWSTIEATMGKWTNRELESLEQALDADRRARTIAHELIF
jgi:1-deoxy-D-xylulose-5-phosphate reductoisomerase